VRRRETNPVYKDFSRESIDQREITSSSSLDRIVPSPDQASLPAPASADQSEFPGLGCGNLEFTRIWIMFTRMLARICDLTGRVSEAVPLYERAVALGTNALHPDVEALFMRNYADVLLRVGRPEEAAKLREDATALQLGLKK
jgi:hypothetical protein